jgi:hypothetical protein
MTEFEKDLREKADTAIEQAQEKINEINDGTEPSGNAQIAGPADSDPNALPIKGA